MKPSSTTHASGASPHVCGGLGRVGELRGGASVGLLRDLRGQHPRTERERGGSGGRDNRGAEVVGIHRDEEAEMLNGELGASYLGGGVHVAPLHGPELGSVGAVRVPSLTADVS